MALKKEEKDGKSYKVRTMSMTTGASDVLDKLYEDARKVAKEKGVKPPSMAAIVSFAIKKIEKIKPADLVKQIGG